MTDHEAEYSAYTTDTLSTVPAAKPAHDEPWMATDPVTWKAYPMAWVMIEAPTHGMASPRSARVRVVDEGGGPYLCVEFFNDDPYPHSDEKQTEGYFSNAGQIDRFASALKDLLRAAEEAGK